MDHLGVIVTAVIMAGCIFFFFGPHLGGILFMASHPDLTLSNSHKIWSGIDQFPPSDLHSLFGELFLQFITVGLLAGVFPLLFVIWVILPLEAPTIKTIALSIILTSAVGALVYGWQDYKKTLEDR